MRKVAAAVAILLSGCGSEAQRPAQPVHFNPAGNYIHQATSFVFPRLLGGFTRSGITEYNREKTDVSAGYDKVAGGQSAMATVYVYPAPPVSSIASPQAVADAAKENLCTQAWEGIKADIIRAHPDAQLVVLDTIPSPSPVSRRQGRRAIYQFTGNFGGSIQPLRSEADLFCYAGQDWLVAYRTTAPAAFDYRPDLVALMRALQWPVGLAR